MCILTFCRAHSEGPPGASPIQKENAMNTRTRCLAILDILQKQHQVKVNELAEVFQTSEMTIRRDLNLLTQQYNITRTHGGAMLAQDSVVRMISFDDAKIEHKEAKELIAQKAVELLDNRQRIFIDAGSTTRHMINYITDDMRNVIVTNNLTVAGVALQHRNLSVIMLGGEMLHVANCSSGIVAEEQIARYQLDIAFLGAAAVGTDGKIYDGYSPEARLKGTIFEVSKKIVLMVDSSKFNCYDLHEFGSLKQVDVVITDSGIDKDGMNLLNKNKVEVIIAR
jgi:DeoR/GlpR family transcriptional regulator of sugar metabolism